MAALPFMSTRFAMKRFLGLSEEEIKENQKMWHEERTTPEEEGAKGSDLRSIGISTGDVQSDLDMADGMSDDGEEGMDGMDVAPPVTPPAGGGGGMGGAGGAAAAPPPM
jgi:hypothetical protein